MTPSNIQLLLLLLLHLLSVTSAPSPSSPPKLLTDHPCHDPRPMAPLPRHSSDTAAAPVTCAAVSDPLRPGLTIGGYELIERSELLGVCKQEPTLWPVQTRDKMEVVVQRPFQKEPMLVCPLPGAAGFQVPPLPQPLTDVGNREEESPEGPVLEYYYDIEEAERIYVNAHYRLKKKFDAGSHGEVWRATRRHARGHPQEHFVLKRLFLELGESMVQMGMREAHFGELLRTEPHVTRFVEYFFRSRDVMEEKEEGRAQVTPELWLVFYDEGKSLRQYLYEKLQVVNGHGHGDAGVVLQPSPFWKKLRADGRGESALREIMCQLLQVVAALHARGITHRDIKPSNILVSIPPSTSITATPSKPVVKLADFGSAVDDYTLRNLYAAPGGNGAAAGPSQAEETREYQPPEVLFSDNGQPYDYTAPEAYDLWSVGVVFLEMVLGSPQVFLISPRERAKLDVVLDAQRRTYRQTHARYSTSSNEADVETRWRTKAYSLHVLTHEFCIFQPAPQQLRSLWDKYALVSESCHFGRFNQTVIERDPLKRGLEDSWGLDLMWKLLQWNPSERIPAAEALQHAYFQGPYVCRQSGRQFATRQELLLHGRYLEAQRARESVFASMVRAKYELPDRFSCLHCGRQFATAQSCEQHVYARRHDTVSSFCAFEDLEISSAIQMESQPLYVHPVLEESAVGIALFQGRKKFMEDFVLVLSEQQLKESCVQDGTTALGFDLYAVVDGHLGSAAATFVVENLPHVLCRHFAAIAKSSEDSTPLDVKVSSSTAGNTSSARQELAEKFALRQTFLELHEGFLDSLEKAASPTAQGRNNSAIAGEDFSGCTLTMVLHFRHQRRVVSANVGDSRALAWLPDTLVTPDGPRDHFAHIVPLSMDHWPNDPGERSRIESSGGFVEFSGLWRVVGQLAVSRSLGDRHLRKFVTAEPSVFHAQLDSSKGGGYLVIASDGLWETMSTDDVVRFLNERQPNGPGREGNRTHDEAATLNDLATKLLTEGYVRGSLDNMALVLVSLPS